MQIKGEQSAYIRKRDWRLRISKISQNPVDLIPDVPLVGWLDDIGVVALVGAWLTRRISEYRDPGVEVRILAGAERA